MFRRIFSRRSVITAAPFLLLIFLFSPQTAQAQAGNVTVYGINTSNQLVRFNPATPNTVTIVGAITGLQAGENIVGIDFRPANGQLYALGSASRLYTINLNNAAATAAGAAGAFTLNGTDFGFDFNPTVDRIRVVSNTGQNLRLNPNDGTLTATDGTLNPGTPSVTAAAYTNNFAGATATTLYDIDTATDTLFIQNPPNNGTLVSVGALGVDASGVNGFDISGRDGTAYAALTVGGSSQLYTINLTSGAATSAGALGGQTLRGIAIAFGGGANLSSVLDFDGDRRSDYSVFRTTNNTWYVRRSSDGGFFGQPFGQSQTDTLTPADYDGDGRTDISVFRNTNGTFYTLRSSDNALAVVQFGAAGDEPVSRDYDGNGRADYAVVRRAGGAMIWYVLTNPATHTFTGAQFGLATDATAPGDYDGDGRFDLAVYRGSGNSPATFYVQRSTAGFTAVQFGLGSDLVVPGDYDGDGKTDYAVVRTGTSYNWYVLRSSNGGFFTVQLGSKPDIPAQADYDGDGRTDVTVFVQELGTFYTARSGSNGAVTTQQFGSNGDVPVASYDTH